MYGRKRRECKEAQTRLDRFTKLVLGVAGGYYHRQKTSQVFCRGAEIRTRTTCSQSMRATVTPRPECCQE